MIANKKPNISLTKHAFISMNVTKKLICINSNVLKFAIKNFA